MSRNRRADGRVQLSVVTGRDAAGKLQRKYFYGATKAEAQRKKDAYLQSKQTAPVSAITVEQWVDEYMKAYRANVNPLYKSNDAVPYERLKRDLGTRALASIREIDLQASVNALAGMSFSTCDKYIQAVKRVFKKARKNRLIPEDPAEDLELPQYTKGTHRALTKDEIDLILKYWQESPAGLWIMLMLFCGLRRGEMMALDWSAIDLPSRTITVRQTAVINGNTAIVEPRTKTAAGLRVIPIPEPLYNALSSVPHRAGFVCLSAHGKPLTESAVSRGLDRFCNVVSRLMADRPKNPSRTNKKDELPSLFKFRTHDLRHTYCSLLYAAGVDVKTAAYLLGHADISVTMKIYTHLSEEKKTVSTDALTAYISTLSGTNDVKMMSTGST